MAALHEARLAGRAPRQRVEDRREQPEPDEAPAAQAGGSVSLPSVGGVAYSFGRNANGASVLFVGGVPQPVQER